jgi:methanogenic corrinoid protein MtbC1
MTYGIDPTQAPVTRVALLAALVDGDLDTAYRVATGLLEEGVPFEALIGEVLSPVARDLGVRWADGDLSVADEHAATAAAEDLVTLLAGGFAPPTGPVVVVVCPEGDSHSLPARVVAAVLTLRGFRSVLLGASLPADDLGDYLERQDPMAVALSVSMPAALYRAVASIGSAHSQGVPVVAGGRALRADQLLARRLGVDAWAPDAEVAAAVLDRWRTEPPATLSEPPAVPDECVVIDAHRTELLAAAVRPDDAEAGRDLVDEVNRLLDVAQGALLLDAPALLADQLAALRSTRNPRGVPGAVIDRLVTRLATATAGERRLPATAALFGGVAPGAG